MPIISVYITHEELRQLERAAEELDRTMKELADAALSEAISRYKREQPSSFPDTQLNQP